MSETETNDEQIQKLIDADGKDWSDVNGFIHMAMPVFGIRFPDGGASAMDGAVVLFSSSDKAQHYIENAGGYVTSAFNEGQKIEIREIPLSKVKMAGIDSVILDYYGFSLI